MASPGASAVELISCRPAGLAFVVPVQPLPATRRSFFSVTGLLEIGFLPDCNDPCQQFSLPAVGHRTHRGGDGGMTIVAHVLGRKHLMTIQVVASPR